MISLTLSLNITFMLVLRKNAYGITTNYTKIKANVKTIFAFYFHSVGQNCSPFYRVFLKNFGPFLRHFALTATLNLQKIVKTCHIPHYELVLGNLYNYCISFQDHLNL